jgi:hypothetical protein
LGAGKLTNQGSRKMYQSGITERNGKFGLWINSYGYVWFNTLEQAEQAYKANPVR